MKLEGEAAMSLIKGFANGRTRRSTRNGLMCPQCGNELVDTEVGVIHLDPPRKRIKCLACDYKEFRPIQVSEIVKDD